MRKCVMCRVAVRRVNASRGSDKHRDPDFILQTNCSHLATPDPIERQVTGTFFAIHYEQAGEFNVLRFSHTVTPTQAK
jgi:hypothetical protein